MACANHSIYINGINVNLGQFSVFWQRTDGTWDQVTDGRKLQAMVNKLGDPVVTFSVCANGAEPSEAEHGWVTQTSAKFILGKGKRIAKGKKDPNFTDRTASSEGHALARVAFLTSERLREDAFASEEKRAKNWRKAQADALLWAFEERIALGKDPEEAFSTVIDATFGKRLGAGRLKEEIDRTYGASAEKREVLASLNRMVANDTLEPALHTLASFRAAQDATSPAAQTLAPRKNLNLRSASTLIEALRTQHSSVPPTVIASFLSQCSSYGGYERLSPSELSNPEVHRALSAIGFKERPALSIIDVADVAGSITSHTRTQGVGPSNWTTVDGGTVSFEGLRAIHSIDVADAASLLSLKPVRDSRPTLDPDIAKNELGSALPPDTISTPDQLRRAARALKAAQAVLSYNTAAYGGQHALDLADRIETLTSMNSISETTRFLNDHLHKAEPARASKELRELRAATDKARVILHSTIAGAIQRESAIQNVISDAANPKAVDELVDAILLNGHPATFLRAISSTRTTIELMRFSVASGYVPRKGGNIEDTAADIQRALTT
jgi:hypothetical protein